ncbi:MAG TPA: glycerol dehydratase reactivase beta/small subunit family protein [Arachnia sp.]|jgi:hypothetical protein|nr:glycerol dehydratase reactivase beta/small subunit family protein [Arachnia sp.]
MIDGPPAICVHVHEATTDAHLADLLLGIEEEGVPVEVSRHDHLNPLVLAHDAAVTSRLGIGLGVALDYVVITTDKLPEHRPYVARHFARGGRADRIVGSNAARIVKRIPLRDFAPGT